MVMIEEHIENTPVPANPTFFEDIKGFTKNHPFLSAGTLGLAVIAYGAANLVGRAVTRLLQCFGTTKKAQDIAANRFNRSPISEFEMSQLQRKISVNTSHPNTAIVDKTQEIAFAPIRITQDGDRFTDLSVEEIESKGGIILTKNYNTHKNKGFVGIAAKYEKEEKGYRLYLCPGTDHSHFDSFQIIRYMNDAIETLTRERIKITSIAGSVGGHSGDTIGNFQKWQQFKRPNGISRS